MKTVTTIEQLKIEIQTYRSQGLSVGFVPTMGALHEGHMSLVKESTRNNAVTVVSIFVNPTQFNDRNDLDNYPVTVEEDQRLLIKAEATLLFCPKYTELYADSYCYRVSESKLSGTLCGAHRPGHFDGVLTVVMKLLNLVEPTNAYFGEKDYQQLELVKGMAGAFFMKTKIVPCPTIREADGLAMSSRNRRLTPEQRAVATQFPQILARAGMSNQDRARALRSLGFEVDYIEEIGDRRLAAVKIGQVRLIDNIKLGDINLAEETSCETQNAV